MAKGSYLKVLCLSKHASEGRVTPHPPVFCSFGLLRDFNLGVSQYRLACYVADPTVDTETVQDEFCIKQERFVNNVYI